MLIFKQKKSEFWEISSKTKWEGKTGIYLSFEIGVRVRRSAAATNWNEGSLWRCM